MAQRVTLKDIAEAAGVSAMSVSKALNNKAGVSEQKRKQILDIAKRMNYTPNMVAKSLRIDETKTIGVVLADSSELVTSKVLRGIQDGASNKGYSVIVCNTDNQRDLEERAIQTLMSKQIDGLILVAPFFYSDDKLKALQQYGIPVVMLMRKNDRVDIDTVINDNYLGGYQTVAHLIEEGCRLFQILGMERVEVSTEREHGYEQAFRDYHIPQSAYSIEYVPPFIEAGYKTTKELLFSGAKFDALVCACDMIAIGAMEAVLEQNLRIPEDVRIIGYDGIDFGKYLRVPLSTMAQPLYEIGQSGVEILLNRIQNPQISVRKIVLKCKLLVRTSTHLARRPVDALWEGL